MRSRTQLSALVIILSLVCATTFAALTPKQVVGSWNVTLSANHSRCDSVKRGDVQAMQWVINMKATGEVSIKTLGSDNANDSYVGKVSGNHIWAENADFRQKRHRATIELEFNDGSLTGRRVVANAPSDGPCAIIYDVSGKKL